MDAARFVLALLGAADALKNPNTTLLGSWPMVHAHDAATTYLSTGIVDEWAKTQQDGGVASLFECGARALDWRPSLKDGVLQMHHGDIDIEYAMSDALDEAAAWANAHVDVEDLILLVISHEDGDGAHAAVLELLGTAGVAYVDDCAGLYSTTVAAAADAARLPGGGSMMAISGTCVTGHWDSSITCAGFKSRRLEETTATNATAANGAVDFPWYYTCYADSSSKDYSSRCGSPAKPRRERPGDHIFSDAYGMRRLRGAAPRLPDVDAAPRSPASPSRPSTKGARKPNPLREFKLSTSARKFPRNPNPRSPPLPFVVAF